MLAARVGPQPSSLATRSCDDRRPWCLGVPHQNAVGDQVSPWQNSFAERLIGSIRRECLNHVLVLGEQHLRRILTRYLAYYHQARTHLALDKDAPDLRPIELPVTGKIVELPEVGGLHHRYVRQAA